MPWPPLQHSRNTLGKIPLEWYDDFPHIGYDLNGEKMWKPAKGDALEDFLSKMEDPDKWWYAARHAPSMP